MQHARKDEKFIRNTAVPIPMRRNNSEYSDVDWRKYSGAIKRVCEGVKWISISPGTVVKAVMILEVD
jgi:hypothetical protein